MTAQQASEVGCHPAAVKLREGGASKVKVAVSDIDGVLRGKCLHLDKFEGALAGGFGFRDVVLGWDMLDTTHDNAQVTGWQHGFPDALARIDPATARRVPWEEFHFRRVGVVDDMPLLLDFLAATRVAQTA